MAGKSRAAVTDELLSLIKEKGIELFHPISHGEVDDDGKNVSFEFSRGVYQCTDAEAADYIRPDLAAQFLGLRHLTRTGEILVAGFLKSPERPAKGVVTIEGREKDELE